MVSVAASELQKNFGEWHDRSFEEPVEITKYGRTSSYLVSATLFKALWSSYRRSLPVSALSENEVNMIASSVMEPGEDYNLDDIPELDETPNEFGL